MWSCDLTLGENGLMTDASHLHDVIRELDDHIANSGWDQPTALFAIVSGDPDSPEQTDAASVQSNKQLLFEPQGIDFSDQAIIDVLRTLGWDEAVSGLAIAAERIISVENEDAKDLEQDAYSTTQEIRVLAIVMRTGETMNAIRYRSHDEPDDLLTGENLVPELNQALLMSLTTD